MGDAHIAHGVAEAVVASATAPFVAPGLVTPRLGGPRLAAPRLAAPGAWPAVWAGADTIAAKRRSRSSLGVALSGNKALASAVRWLKLSVYVAPFIAVAAAYEGVRAFFRHPELVHVGDLLALEHRLFSIPTASGRRAICDIIASHTHPLLDLWCGLTYLLWVPEVFAMAALLFVRARPKALHLALGFLAVNLAGWAIWILYPAAPPWYVDLYGTGPTVIDAPASTAGLARLDALLGVPIAASLYSKSAYVFGAMPSLHVAYSVLVASVVFPLGGRLRALTLGIAASMAFSALYLRHHYVLDVIAGIALGVPVALATGALLRRFSRAPVEQAAASRSTATPSEAV